MTTEQAQKLDQRTHEEKRDRPDSLWNRCRQHAMPDVSIKINEITIQRKINLGNYESMNVECKVVPATPQCNYDTLKQVIIGVDMEILDAIEQRTSGNKGEEQ